MGVGVGVGGWVAGWLGGFGCCFWMLLVFCLAYVRVGGWEILGFTAFQGLAGGYSWVRGDVLRNCDCAYGRDFPEGVI